MSHFTVLVTAANKDELFDKLLPYKEYGCGSDFGDEMRARGLLEFNVEHEASEFKQAASEIIQKLDGDEDYYQEYLFLFDAECYAAIFKSWSGGQLNPETGDWGHWRGKDEKWDWYTVGGRWSGLLKLKLSDGGDRPHGAENGIGGAFNDANTDDEYSDTAFSKDIDWQGILARQVNKKMATFYRYKAAICKARAGTITKHMDSRVQKAIEIYNDDDGRGEHARAAFASEQDYILDAKADAILAESHADIWGTFQEAADRFYLSEDEYRAKFAADALTYAFIDMDGKWNQRGQMGWFGMDDKSAGTRNYDAAFWDFIESLPRDQRVYVVDCHI